MFDKVIKNTVTNQVIAQVKGLLASGALQTGDRLPPERQMAEQLGVSRPSLREALRALEFSGLLAPLPNGGVCVADGGAVLDSALQSTHLMRQFSLEKVLEARRCIEMTTVQLAACRATDEALYALSRTNEEFRHAVERDKDFVSDDMAFHLGIAEAADNEVLTAMLHSSRAMLHDFCSTVLACDEDRSATMSHHQRILEALQQRDPVAATERMAEHLDSLVAVLQRTT